MEIRIHGRGGQGGVTCAKILATLYAGQGKSVQSFGDYAGERSGAPVRAFVRVADAPITNRNTLELVRLAVGSGLYPVCEVFAGTRWVINVEPDAGVEALPRYLSLQGRFGDESVELGDLRSQIRRHWKHLRHLGSPEAAGP